MLGIAPLSTLPISTLPDGGAPATPTTLGAFVNTADQPQIANYGLIAGIGFFCAALVGGSVPGSNAQEYRHGTHAAAVQNAENVKSTIFRAQVTPPVTVTAVPQFISVQQQKYDDVKPSLFKPVIIGQGAVPARTLAPPQSDPTQTAAQVFTPFTPTAIVPNPITTFFSVPPQDDNRQVSTVWKAQVSGQTPPVIPFVRGAPQNDPTQLAALVIKAAQPAEITANPIASFFSTLPQPEDRLSAKVFPPAITQPVSAAWVPPAVIGLQQKYSDILPAAIMPSLVAGSLPGANAQEYRWGSHAQATHEAERAKSQVWKSAPTPIVVTGDLASFIRAAPQSDPSQISAQIFKSLQAAPDVSYANQHIFDEPQVEIRGTATIFKPPLIGKTPPVITSLFAAPQQVDLTQQAQITPIAIVPPVVSYANTQIYGAPQLADLTLQGWIKGAAPVRQGGVPPITAGAPQLIDLTQQAVVTPIAKTQPVFGAVPPLTMGGMPQADTTQIAAFVIAPLEFGIPLPPVVVSDVVVSGVPGARQTARRRYILPDETVVFATRQEVEDILDRYSRLKTVKAKSKPKAVAAVVESQLELATFTRPADAPQTTIVKLPDTLVFAPTGSDWKQLIIKMRRRADDEFLLLW